MDPNTIQEVAKATQEVAKVAASMGKFISDIIEKPLEQGVGIWTDNLKYRRFENQVRLYDKTVKLFHDRGMVGPTRPLPMKLAIPLMQFAAIEDDPDLQDLWANLLVNFVDKNSGINPSLTYIELLKSLSPLEAKIMATLYTFQYDLSSQAGLYTKDLPVSTALASFSNESEEQRQVSISDDVVLALSNLDRLGLVVVARSVAGGKLFYKVNNTEMGKFLTQACSNAKVVQA